MPAFVLQDIMLFIWILYLKVSNFYIDLKVNVSNQITLYLHIWIFVRFSTFFFAINSCVRYDRIHSSRILARSDCHRNNWQAQKEPWLQTRSSIKIFHLSNKKLIFLSWRKAFHIPVQPNHMWYFCIFVFIVILHLAIGRRNCDGWRLLIWPFAF